MQRIFLIVLSTFLVMFAWADNERTIQYHWVYESGSSNTIIGVKVISKGSANGDIVIPEMMYDYPVVEIASGVFYEATDITSVVLPATITKIGARAFEGCRALTKVDFGESLQTIEEYAFSRCTKLQSITLPNTTKEIHANAFWSCNSLTTAHLGNSLTYIGDNAFQYCLGLKSISLPNTLSSVGDHFLCSCKSLETVVVPENLTAIGSYFLHGCENMKSVYLMGDKGRTLGEFPFVSQVQQGLRQINNCVFYVDSKDVYDTYYKNTANWKYADEANTEHISGDGNYQNDGNRYEWKQRPDGIRPYEAQWITVCYPTDIDVKTVFGDQALLAEMTSAEYKGTDASGEHLYHINFTLVTDNILQANVPYLLKVDPKNVGSAFIVEHVADAANKTDEELVTTVDISNQHRDPSASLTQLRMLGTYAENGRVLQPGEFLFYNNKGNMKFYKQLKNGKQRSVGTYRCYWQIIKDYDIVTNAKLGVLDTGTTGIKTEIHIHEPDHTDVFNLQGQMVSSKGMQDDKRPAGIYIMDGKKMIVR